MHSWINPDVTCYLVVRWNKVTSYNYLYFIMKLRNIVTYNSLLPNTGYRLGFPLVGMLDGYFGQHVQFILQCVIWEEFFMTLTQENNVTSGSPREIGWERDHISSPVWGKLPLKSHITDPPGRLADGVNVPRMEEAVSVSQWPRFDLLRDSAWTFAQLPLNFLHSWFVLRHRCR